MQGWKQTVKIKHLFTEEENYESVQNCMNAVADILERTPAFRGFMVLKKFRSIPEGDDIFSPVDYADKLLGKMYDYADQKRIWIE